MGAHGTKFQEALTKAQQNDDDLQKMWKKYDKDHNGALDRKEMQKFLTDYACFLEALEKKYGENPLQAHKWDWVRTHTDRVYTVVDTDGNGSISLEEFKQLIKKPMIAWMEILGNAGYYRELLKTDLIADEEGWKKGMRMLGLKDEWLEDEKK